MGDKIAGWKRQLDNPTPKPLFRGASDFWFLSGKFLRENKIIDILDNLENEIDNTWDEFFSKTDKDFF